MDTSTITPAKTATQPGTTAAPASAINADFDLFLRMLTTQMQNQDPLNPIESSDYAVQLATFSGVEQQTRTNQLLQSLLSQMGVMGLSELAGWVGQEVRSASSVFLADSPVELVLAPDAGADRLVLAVRDGTGNVVARQDVAAGTTSLVWQGLDATGAPLPAGRYDLTLESWAGDSKLSATPVESWSRVAELRSSGGTTQLVLAGGAEIAAAAVTGLRPRQ